MERVIEYQFQMKWNMRSSYRRWYSMTDMQKKMMDKLGISESDFEPMDKDALIEEAYLKSEYNSILIEMMMEV